MKFALRFLAGLLAVILLLISLSLAAVGFVLKIPGMFVDFISKLIFMLGNRIAKQLIMGKVKESLGKMVKELQDKQKQEENK